MTYDFSDADIPLAVNIFDSAVKLEPDPMKAWMALSSDRDFLKLPSDLKAEIDFLFAYELRKSDVRPRAIELLDPELTLTRTRPMADTPIGALKLWSNICGQIQSPGLNALISDLLLTLGAEARPHHASRTIGFYVAASASNTLDASQASLMLLRANTLARTRKMVEESMVRAAMESVLENNVNDPSHAGPALMLLSAMVHTPRTGEFPTEKRVTIRRQITLVGEMSNLYVEECAELLRVLALNPSEREAANRWEVSQYLDYARIADHGMRQMSFAEQAAQLSIDYGLDDLKDEAVTFMQSIDQESMGWTTATVEGAFSKNVFRCNLQKYRRAHYWQHAVRIFLGGSAPSGNHAENIERAKRQGFSIRSMVTRVSFGSHGLPERTNADFLEDEVTRNEEYIIKFSAVLLANELEHIQTRYSVPSTDDVVAWLRDHLGSDPTLAAHFAESLTHHFKGEYSTSARLSIPLVELAARQLLQHLGHPLYRVQRGDSPGRFPALDEYVKVLIENDFDPDWIRTLRVALLSPGMNLRNRAAHGFQINFSEEESALLLRIAGLFCSMPIKPQELELREPLVNVRRKLRRRRGWIWA